MQGRPGTERQAPLRIVVVDDHPPIRAGVRAALAGSEMHVVAEAGDGHAALAMCQQQQPDVAVVDMYLPYVNGVELVKELSLSLPALKVVIYSMSEDAWLVREALAAGALAYVFKRSAPEQLKRAIRQVAEGRVYVDSALPDRSLAQPVPGASLLSKRELEVLRLCARGVPTKEAAATLALSPRTLETYRARAMHKLQLRSRVDLMRYAVHSGWLS